MKTAAYTIIKNEINRIDNWLKYTKKFNYQVLLDTGSTDGTWEYLNEKVSEFPGLIIEQKTFEPWDFSVARNYNLTMIPSDVDWCLSPDADEFFSVNVLEEMIKVIEQNPTVTNINTTRIDVYAPQVLVGPQTGILPTNKIHRMNEYEWRQPIYEHLWYIGNHQENEVYAEKIFLIHNQETEKDRSFYVDMLLTHYNKDNTNTWVSWFLLNEYYRERKINEYIPVAINYAKSAFDKDRKKEVFLDLLKIYKGANSKVSEDNMVLLGEFFRAFY